MRIELIQRQATKFIAGPEMHYTSRLIFLHLQSLESCHHVKYLTTGYKYLNGFIEVLGLDLSTIRTSASFL